MPNADDPIGRVTIACLTGAAKLACISAAGVVLWQCFQYAKTGAWPSRSVLWGAQWAFEPALNSWWFAPMDWHGVHNMLSATPLSVGFVALALVLAAAAGLVESTGPTK